jgi:hypothetical protein
MRQTKNYIFSINYVLYQNKLFQNSGLRVKLAFGNEPKI